MIRRFTNAAGRTGGLVSIDVQTARLRPFAGHKPPERATAGRTQADLHVLEGGGSATAVLRPLRRQRPALRRAMSSWGRAVILDGEETP